MSIMAEITTIASGLFMVHNIIRRNTQLLALILYIILYRYYIDIKLRESANVNNHFLLHVAIHSGLQLAVIKKHHAKFAEKLTFSN